VTGVGMNDMLIAIAEDLAQDVRGLLGHDRIAAPVEADHVKVGLGGERSKR
jgi:hypothetical protein